MLKSGGSTKVPLCLFDQIAKRKLQKRELVRPRMTRRSVTLDEGKLTDFVFFDYFQTKLKMQNIFSIMNCKETYLSWNNLKE